MRTPRAFHLSRVGFVLLTLGLVACGFTCISFAVFLDSECQLNPIDNARCWERQAYAYGGYALWITAATMICVAVIRRLIGGRAPHDSES